MFKYLKSQVIKPSVMEQAASELDDAKRLLLEAYTQFDLAFGNITFLENRVSRLEEFIRTGKLIQSAYEYNETIH